MANFNKKFQTNVVAVMLRDAHFAKINGTNISPNYFEDAYLVGVVTEIRKFVQDYGEAPTIATLLQICEDRASSRKEKVERYAEAIEQMLDVPAADIDFTRQYMNDFVKVQAVKAAMLKSVNYLGDVEQLSKIREEIEGAFTATVYDEEDRFYDYAKETDNRLIPNVDAPKELCVATGLEELDNILGGGLKEAEFGMVVGASGGGKSALLSEFAGNAYRNQKNTLVYSLEMQATRIAKRIDAKLSKTAMADFYAEYDYVRKMVNKYEHAGGGIFIKSYPRKQASVYDLRDNTARIKLVDEITPHLIIIDYIGEIKPFKDVSKAWEGEGEIITSVCAWAQMDKLPIWSAAQVNRMGMKSKTPSIAEVAGDISKVFVADVVVFICQTKDEKIMYQDKEGQQHLERVRLYVGKNRDGKAGQILTYNVDWGSMQFEKVKETEVADASNVKF